MAKCSSMGGRSLNIIKAIIEKLKVKDLFAIIFVAAIVITILPEDLVNALKIEQFRAMYQQYISLCMIIIGAYYIIEIIKSIRRCIMKKIYTEKRVAINYMRKRMNSDEMQLLIETFYDTKSNRFRGSGSIELHDGRKAALETMHVIYRAANVSSFYTRFDYNLQSYALEYLNNNLIAGNIEISENSFKYNLQ